jgi:hypothetical protein
VGLFRRRNETLNEQLLRQAGVDPAQALGDEAPPPEPNPLTLARLTGPYHLTSADVAREWDVSTTATVPGLAGDRVEFTTLPNGDVIVGKEEGDGDVTPLADTLEQNLSPPYRAVATRQSGDLWGVGAKRIEVAKVPFSSGEQLELSRNGDDGELRVDGEPTDAPIPPELEHLGRAAGDTFYVEASRIDGDLWEVRVTAL